MVLNIYKVSKSYNRGKVKAVSELTLEVKTGEIFGFLGPNGAGKTTTIKMITGLLQPDSGDIKINGVSITKDPLRAKKQFCYVPDQPDVYEKLTGIEYLNFIANAYQVPAKVREQRVRRYLEMFELWDAAGDLMQSYSHGMRQKLVVTGALLPEPKLLILDEPMVGLDPKSSYLLKEVLREHCNKGNTVFFSTHVLEVAEKVCDRVGIINKGRLIACGTLEELRKSAEREDSSLVNIFLELTEHE